MRKHISIPLEKLQIDMFSIDITCQHCKNQITFEQGRILFYITSRPEILQEGQFLSYHEAVMNKMVIQIQINTIYNRIQQTQQTIPYLFLSWKLLWQQYMLQENAYIAFSNSWLKLVVGRY